MSDRDSRQREVRLSRPRRSTPARRPAFWLIVLATALGCASGAPAQTDDTSDTSREYAIKAAYLYQFSRYVQWPPETFAADGAPLVIGILGADPFGGVLDEIARTKRIEGHPIVVRHFAAMADYKPCHILFIGASADPSQMAVALEKLRKSPVLIVGETPSFAEHGGMVNFFVQENRIRFEINTDVVKRGQLKISSKLLSLAKIVGQD